MGRVQDYKKSSSDPNEKAIEESDKEYEIVTEVNLPSK
jgi:hypothetical protein